MRRVAGILAFLLVLLACFAAASGESDIPAIQTAGPIDPAQDFTIAWSAVDNTTEYEVLMRPCDTYDLVLKTTTRQTSYTIDKSYFADNSPCYWIIVTAKLPNNQIARDMQYITAQRTPDARVTVTADKTEMLVNQRVALSVTAPNAEALEIRDDTGRRFSGNGSTWQNQFVYDKPGVRHVWAKARFNGEWSDYSAPCTITVTSYGPLAAPQVSVDDFQVGSPAVVRLTQADDNASYYEIYVADAYNINIGYYYDIQPQELIAGYALPEKLFDGSECVIRVVAYGIGYENNSTEVRVTPTGSRPAGPTITTSDNADFYEIGDVMSFSVSAPGATMLRWKCITFNADGGVTAWYSVREEPYSDNNWKGFEAEVSNGTFVFFASALIDDEWTAFSEKSVQMGESRGTLAKPEFTLPASAELGQPVNIVIEPVDNAGIYTVDGWNGDGMWFSRDFTEAGTYDISDLLAYGTNTVRVRATQRQFIGSDYTQKTIVITGELPPAPTVSLDRTQAAIGNRVFVTATQADAEAFKLGFEIYDSDGNLFRSWWYSAEYPAENGSFEDGFYCSDEYQGCRVVAVVKARVGSLWSEEGRAEFTIDPAPVLAAPEVTVPSTVTAGTVVKATISAVENAQNYYVNMYDTSNGYSYCGRVELQPGVEAELSPLNAPGNYELEFVASANGYARGVTTRYLTIQQGEMASAPTVTAPESCTISSEFTYTVARENATQYAVMFKILREDGSEYSNSNQILEGGDTATGSFRAWNEIAGMRIMIQASAVVDGKVTATSDPVYVQVEEAPRIAAPEVTLPTGPVEAGTIVRTTVSAVDNAENYTVHISRGGDRVGSMGLQPGQETALYQLAEPGSYLLEYIISARGYVPGRVTRNLTVSEGEMASAPTVTAPESCTISSEFTYTVARENATQYAVMFKILREDGSEYSNSNQILEGGDTATGSFYVWTNLSGMRIMIQANAVVDGKLTHTSAPVYVQVQEMAKLSTPAVSVVTNPVQAGQTPQLTIGAVDGADTYCVDTANGDGSWLCNAFSQPGTADLEWLTDPGAYTLQVFARGSGYLDSDPVTVTVTIEGTLAAGPALSFIKRDAEGTAEITEATIGESYYATVQQEGADRIRLSLDILNADGTVYSNYYSNSEYYVYNSVADCGISVNPEWNGKTLRFSARSRVNGAWTDWSTLDIPVAEAETLAQPVFTLPASFSQNEVLQIAVNAVENATSYDVDIRQENRQVWGGSFDHAGTLTLDYALDAGVYDITVTANAPGFVPASATQQLSAAASELHSAPAIAANDECPLSSPVRATITCEGAEAFYVKTDILFEGGYSSEMGASRYEPTDDGVLAYQFQAWNQVAQVSIQAWALVDGEWTAKSDVVNIAITEPVPPTLSVSATAPTPDSDAVVTIGGECSGYYYVMITAPSGDTIYSDYAYQPGDISIDRTLFTETGTYTVTVEAISNYGNATDTAAFSVESDYCGPNARWTLENGTLTITGSGTMYNYYDAVTPWDKSEVRSVVIGSGITGVGGYAFSGCGNLTCATLPASITGIGEGAFDNSGLSAVYYYENTVIENWASAHGVPAFRLDANILRLPADTTTIESEAFAGLSVPVIVEIPATVTTIAGNAFSGSTVAFRCPDNNIAAEYAAEHQIPIAPN